MGKSSRKRPPWWLLACMFSVIIACVVWAICNGGLLVVNEHLLIADHNVPLWSGIESSVWLSPRLFESGVPGIAARHVYTAPYDLRIIAWASADSFERITIDEIVVTFDDGSHLRHVDVGSKPLDARTLYNSSDQGVVETRIYQVDWTIDKVVPRFASAVVEMRGRVLKRDGKEIGFKFSERFETDSRHNVATYYAAWKSV